MSSQTTTPLHPRPQKLATTATPNPLPTLLQTPSGLALLELQGTINLPPNTSTSISSSPEAAAAAAAAIPIGRIHFEDYHSETEKAGGGEGNGDDWMKRVWMYVGEHQRLQGEVKKLPRAVAVLRKRAVAGAAAAGDAEMEDKEEREEGEGELEVVEIVRYKVVFSSRPEPVGSGAFGGGL
ncbi:chromosome transmission fidelity protein [Chaetomidium leptoderma]|uniref:Chromosome transmission fidelity protein n=1 Tax=Chaetomidium leptoderma TaxID=669021 RepID=A0AAN6VJ28_9PEZI|nr:chromosome transmission fidelity protein [Chaetomidium leptoderma]